MDTLTVRRLISSALLVLCFVCFGSVSATADDTDTDADADTDADTEKTDAEKADAEKKDAAKTSADPIKIHPTLREFYRTGRYLMYISGKLQKNARIFHSRRAGAFLVVDSSYKTPLLIEPKELRVGSLPLELLVERADKGLDVVSKVSIDELGDLRLDGGGMAIEVHGLTARLQPQPHLLGANDAGGVLLHSPEYERGGSRYTPKANLIRTINASAKPVEVVIFFGTWCPTCKRLLPRILRVDRAIGASKVNITYYGLPKGKAMLQDPEARRAGVKAIPTGVLMVNGKPAGKISSKSWSRPEAAIARLVR